MSARPDIRLSPEQELRMALAWDVRIALRSGKDEVIRYVVSSEARQPVAHAIYEDSIGKPELVAAFEEVAKAYGRRASFGVIGDLFTKYMDAATDHYVEVLAEGIEDPERQLNVSFQPPVKRK